MIVGSPSAIVAMLYQHMPTPAGGVRAGACHKGMPSSNRGGTQKREHSKEEAGYQYNVPQKGQMERADCSSCL